MRTIFSVLVLLSTISPALADVGTNDLLLTVHPEISENSQTAKWGDENKPFNDQLQRAHWNVTNTPNLIQAAGGRVDEDDCTPNKPKRAIFGPGMKVLCHKSAFPVKHPFKSVGFITFPGRHPQVAFNNYSHWTATTPNGPGYSSLMKLGTAGAAGAVAGGVYARGR